MDASSWAGLNTMGSESLCGPLISDGMVGGSSKHALSYALPQQSHMMRAGRQSTGRGMKRGISQGMMVSRRSFTSDGSRVQKRYLPTMAGGSFPPMQEQQHQPYLPWMQQHHHQYQPKQPQHQHQQHQQPQQHLQIQRQQERPARQVLYHNPHRQHLLHSALLLQPQSSAHLEFTSSPQPLSSEPWRLKMAQPSFPSVDTDEMAQLQKLSNEYEPETHGPYVGVRVPSTAITTEYATADPVFQAKTTNLPRKYSHYRTILGDGKCGWRAVAFGYFEALIRVGDNNKFAEEEARLSSLRNVLTTAGYAEIVFEDFAGEMYEWLQQLRASVAANQDTDAALYSMFQDESRQNYIITYLKLLASAWMKTHSDEFAPYLLGTTVESYCDTNVMPLASEIEDVSMNALRSVLLAPVGLALEIVYLDRSDSSEANTHHFDPIGRIIGTIRLLYRPGHYDLLYKIEDIPAPATSVQAYYQFASPTQQAPIYDIGFQDLLTSIPGMSFVDPHPSWATPSYASSDTFASQSPVTYAPHHSSVSSTAMLDINETLPDQGGKGTSQMPKRAASTPQPITYSAHSSDSVSPGATSTDAGPFRKSAWELEPELAVATSQMPFRTAIFRNSHFNTAHFLNPEFQPEEWRPEDDYLVPHPHRSSSYDSSQDKNVRHCNME